METSQLSQATNERGVCSLSSDQEDQTVGPVVSTADLDLPKLRAQLATLPEADAVEEILKYQTNALQRQDIVDEHFIQLATILEDNSYGQNTPLVGREKCAPFWDKVIAAHKSMQRRSLWAQGLRATLPEEVVDYYHLCGLGQTALWSLYRMTKQHVSLVPDSAPSQRWLFLVVELNRAMLRRDRKWRPGRRISPNVGMLIGQHYASSKHQDAWRPFEPQDFQNVMDNVSFSHSRQLRHSDWDLSREETWIYLESNELGFGEHGALVPKTGKLNEGLMERFLLPTLPNRSTDLPAPPSPPSRTSPRSGVRSSSTIAPSDLVSLQHISHGNQRLQGSRLRKVAPPQKGSFIKKSAQTKHSTRSQSLIQDPNGRVARKVTSVIQGSPVSSRRDLDKSAEWHGIADDLRRALARLERLRTDDRGRNADDADRKQLEISIASALLVAQRKATRTLW